MAQKIRFTKMHGCGNDYIYVNTMEQSVPNPQEAAIRWSDRHKGIGSDGLVLIGKSPVPEADFSMRIFNADGSEAMMCGNASRCIGKYLYEKTHPWPLSVKEGNGYQETEIRLLTLSGVKILYLHIVDGVVERVTVDMGEPVLENESQFLGNRVLDKGTFVSMGNPHYVIFTDLSLRRLSAGKPQTKLRLTTPPFALAFGRGVVALQRLVVQEPVLPLLLRH